MKNLILICFCCIITSGTIAQGEFGKNTKTDEGQDTIQRTNRDPDRHYFDLGLGLGLDYGGAIGSKFTYVPFRHLGVFGSFVPIPRASVE